MNKKSFILAIFIVFVVLLGSSSSFAQNINNDLSIDVDDATIEETDNIAISEEDTSNDIQISSQHTIKAGSDSKTIQDTINDMNDGDTLNFEDGTYTDICIYINKSITINGNGANLVGYDNPSKANTPEIITKATADGGYAIGNLATLYIVKADNVIINGLTITGGANSSATYSNALVYAMNANNLTFKNNVLDGSSWGLYFQFSNGGIVDSNIIKNQKTTGFLNFGSANTIIENNKIINAENHGIDVRHGTGPNVLVINNTVIGSKEGIYLMHSKGHTAINNTLINCTISSISCYGSSNINIKGNKLQKSRIGILLGGGYSNITVGENTFQLDNLPFPPTFVYFVAEVKADYGSATSMMGTFTDSSRSDVTYVEYSEIPTPKAVNIDYDAILNPTGTTYTVTSGMANSDIQNILDSMNDGDTLSFEENAVFNDISIYTDKNIKILGNNATLIGFDNIDLSNVPEKITKGTDDGGYAIAYRAVLYSVNNTNVVIDDLNIIAQYPGYNPTKVTSTTDEYKTAGIYTTKSLNVAITNCDITGSSWGIFLEYSGGAIVSNNNIHDIYTTGIMNFGTPNSLIANNNIINAVNHGIDVRHGTGPNVTVFNNNITGAKEGIYLMHSQGHNVYNNTVINSKISGITAYGSGNEKIFDNSISGSRIGILLGGNYYNVTIGSNSYKLDSLPFPPTFVYYLAQAENSYQSADDVIGTYFDKYPVDINASTVYTAPNTGKLTFTLTGFEKEAIANSPVSVTIGNDKCNATTDENGCATISLDLNPGIYNATISYAGNHKYASSKSTVKIYVQTTSRITASSKAFYLQAIVKGSSYSITLKDAKGNPLAKKAITITYNGKNYKATTTAKGVAKVTLKATKIGSKKATIKFAGDKVYKAITKTVTIKVTKQASKLTAAKKTFKAKTKTKKYTITLKSKSGKAISKVKVTLKVKGKTYNAKTNAKGKATFKITKLTKKGKYTAKVKFAGTKYFTGKTVKPKITIK